MGSLFPEELEGCAQAFVRMFRLNALAEVLKQKNPPGKKQEDFSCYMMELLKPVLETGD